MASEQPKRLLRRSVRIQTRAQDANVPSPVDRRATGRKRKARAAAAGTSQKKSRIVVNDDTEAAKAFRDLMGPRLRMCRAERLYVQVDHVWHAQSHKRIRRVITESNIHLKLPKRPVMPYSGMNDKQKVLIEQLGVLMDPDAAFDDALAQSTRGKLCYLDGVYDFATRRFCPWSQASGVVTAVTTGRAFVPRSAVSAETRTYIERDVWEKLFPNPVRCKYAKQLLARALAGHTEDKRWMIWSGRRHGGKSTLREWLKTVFGTGYVGQNDAHGIIRRTVHSQNASAVKGKLLLKHPYARFLFFNEPAQKIGAKLAVMNGPLLKEIASGGDDAVTVKWGRSPEFDFVPQALPIVLANEVPPTHPFSAIETLVFLQFEREFARSGLMKEKRGKAALQAAFAHSLFDAYVTSRPDLPALFDADREAYQSTPVGDDHRIRAVIEYVPPDARNRPQVTTSGKELRDALDAAGLYRSPKAWAGVFKSMKGEKTQSATRAWHHLRVRHIHVDEEEDDGGDGDEDRWGTLLDDVDDLMSVSAAQRHLVYDMLEPFADAPNALRAVLQFAGGADGAFFAALVSAYRRRVIP